jgi:ribosomal protein L24E
LIYTDRHPRATKNKPYVHEHVLVMEKLIGRCLTQKERVHHINEVKNDNCPENLLLCANEAAHRVIHRQLRAIQATGHINWRTCMFCKEYDDPTNMKEVVRSDSKTPRLFHNECRNKYRKQQYKKIKLLQEAPCQIKP